MKFFTLKQNQFKSTYLLMFFSQFFSLVPLNGSEHVHTIAY